MKYRPLANTGVFVSELCLGAMTFGSQWEMIGALGQKEADELVDRSLDEGINFFDTADVYSSGKPGSVFASPDRTTTWLHVVRDVYHLVCPKVVNRLTRWGYGRNGET